MAELNTGQCLETAFCYCLAFVGDPTFFRSETAKPRASIRDRHLLPPTNEEVNAFAHVCLSV